MSISAETLVATDAPEPAATGAVTEAVVQVTVEKPINGTEGIKEAVSSKSDTIGSVANTLDSLALQVGATRISVWDMLVVVLVIIAVFFVGYFGSRVAMRLTNRLTKLDPTQRILTEKIASLAVWAIALLVGIDVLGLDLTALAVFSGAFGLAIGFGLQKTFGNLIAGIILLMDKSIKPGDVIAITDQAGNSTFGQIRRIGIRAVSLTTRDQKEYLIPNENLMINQVENWSYSSKRVRIQVPVGVSYRADLEKAEELMLEAARSVNRVLAVPPPTIWLDSMADSSVNFVIHCWITDPEEGIGNVRSAVLKSLWRLFRDNDIEIPFPQRDINVRDSAALKELIEALHARAKS